MTTATQTTERQRQVAHHEAGHAVAATVLGLGVRDAWIGPPPRHGGQCNHDNQDPPALCDLVYTLAGPIAEARYRHGDANLTDRWGGDAEDIGRALVRFSPQDRAEVEAQARTMAQALVTKNWSAIRNVADRLISEGRVTGETVTKIVREML